LNKNIADVMESLADSHNPASFDVRLLEAETAQQYGIAFDSNWYAIPVKSREYMVAARIARLWLDNLQEREITGRMR